MRIPAGGGAVALLLIAVLAVPLYAVRANWGIRAVGPQLEKEGRHEEAAFFFRTGLDFYSVNARPWVEFAVYDPGADEVYVRGAEIFDDKNWIGQDHEERWDTIEGYILFYNRDGLARNVDKGNFTTAQHLRLEDRCRIFTECLINPDWGWGGDFSFARKAWILERCGLFADAAYRREFAGRYAIEVLSRYYAAVADEMERAFKDAACARLYRDKAVSWRKRGLNELRRSNGDRLLARLRPEKRPLRLQRPAVLGLLRKGLSLPEADARWATALILAEMGETAALERAMKDPDAGVREVVAETVAGKESLPGVRPGALVQYFAAGDLKTPSAETTVETVDIGCRFQANFPKRWYDYWDKAEVYPADGEGQFLLRVTAKVCVPADGDYRFYVRTDVPSRLKVVITPPDGKPLEIIASENEKKLQYVAQVGLPENRIDFSEPVSLRKGLASLVIDYTGDEIRKIQQKHFVNISGVQRAGIQLFWSSDRHLMELVPGANLFH